MKEKNKTFISVRRSQIKDEVDEIDTLENEDSVIDAC